jgi:methylated-DNA-[protein]-cysteine S-methyltransferase
MTLYSVIDSPLGELLLTAAEGRLSGLYFSGEAHARINPDWLREDDAPIFAETTRQLEEFASGQRRFFDLPLARLGTPFQMRVWEKIAAIPFGKTISYSDLAQSLGSPEAVRAVGTATGKNPVSWIVPCHRVVGKSGALTGFAGGLDRKRALLDFESGRCSSLVLGEELLAI